jgi:hypothetical protein
MTQHILVRWSHCPSELATWEDEAPLRLQFPRALAWGQARSLGGRDVTTTDKIPTRSEADLEQDVSAETPLAPDEPEDDMKGKERPKRALKANPRAYGPE